MFYKVKSYKLFDKIDLKGIDHKFYFFSIYIIIGFEDKVTMGLARIERTLLEHSQMLRRLISGQPTTSFDGDLDLDDLIPSPVKTVDELAELTARFLEDRDFPKKLVRPLFLLV